MSFDEFTYKRIEKEMKAFMEKHRPPVEKRSQVDLAFRIENRNVIIFEIRPMWKKPEEKMEIPVAKATYVKTNGRWKIFWQGSDLKWHKYDPSPEVENLAGFLKEVEEDKHGCFRG